MAARLQRLLEPISQGLSNGEIADALFLGNQTVKNYVSEIMQTCGCDSRAKLVLHIQRCLKWGK